jgi:hypothetical protein
MEELSEQHKKLIEQLIEMSLAVVPDPDAKINLVRVFDRFHRDIENGQAIIASNPDLEDLLNVAKNNYDWCLFWSVRHPIPSVRARYALELKASQAVNMQIVERVRAMLRKRGIEVLQ